MFAYHSAIQYDSYKIQNSLHCACASLFYKETLGPGVMFSMGMHDNGPIIMLMHWHS